MLSTSCLSHFCTSPIVDGSLVLIPPLWLTFRLIFNVPFIHAFALLLEYSKAVIKVRAQSSALELMENNQLENRSMVSQMLQFTCLLSHYFYVFAMNKYICLSVKLAPWLLGFSQAPCRSHFSTALRRFIFSDRTNHYKRGQDCLKRYYY